MNENLGAVFIEVRAKLEQLNGDFQKAYDQAEKQTSTFAGSVGKTLSNPKMIMGIGAMGVALGAVLTHAGDQLETANKQLEAAASAAGIPMEELKAKTKGLNSEMENLGHTNAQTASAEQIFVQAGRPSNEIMKDMAIAANLAAAKHEDLSVAATSLAKVYSGASKSLKEFGLNVTIGGTNSAKAALDQQKAADQLKAAEENLQKTQEAQAVASANNATGHHTVAQEALFHTTQNQALQKAEDALTKAQDAVTQSSSGLKNGQISASDAVDQLAKKVDGQGKASMDTFGGKIEILKTKMQDLVAHIGSKVGPAITTLSPIIMAMGMVMQTVSFSGIASGISLAAGWIADMAGMAMSTIVAGAEMLIALAPIILPILAIIAVAYLLYRNWDTVWGFVKDLTKSAVDFIKKHVDILVAIIALPLLPLFELIKHWKAVWGEIQDVIHSVSEFIGDRINDITGYFEGMWHFIEGIWEKLKAIFEAIKNGVGDVVQAINPFSSGGLLSHVPGFAAGGTVPGPYGAARLIVAHGGEVVSKKGIDGGGGGGGGTTHNYYTLDERSFNQKVRAAMDANNRYNGPR